MNLDEKDRDIDLTEDPEDLQLLAKSQQDPEVRRNRIQSTMHIFFLYCLIASLIVVVLALFTGPNGECKDPSQGIYCMPSMCFLGTRTALKRLSTWI